MIAADRLAVLASEDFEARVVASSPSTLRLLLENMREVVALRRDYDAGFMTSTDIRNFVEGLLRSSTGDDVFPYQTALSAIAVALSERFTKFAREYLDDLSRVKDSRFWIAARVARTCVRARDRLPGTNYRCFPMGADDTIVRRTHVRDLSDGASAPPRSVSTSFIGVGNA